MSVTTAPTMTATVTSTDVHHSADSHQSHGSPPTLATKTGAVGAMGAVTGPSFPLEAARSRTGSESLSATPAPEVDAYAKEDPSTAFGGAGGTSFSIRQDPLRVTLDAPALFAVALLLAVGVHCVDHALLEASLALIPILLFIRNDYRNYLALGPGGTPSTFSGYCRISWFRLWAIRDPFSPPAPSMLDRRGGRRGKGDGAGSLAVPARGILVPTSGVDSSLTSDSGNPGNSFRTSPLPYRPGPRPVVAGIAPQRQVDQRGTLPCYRALRSALERAAARHPSKLGTARSCLEKHGLGLFALHPVNVTCNGEICHVHDSDRSLHMNLHPDDIREVLLKGWGQRHPLASDAWWGPMPVRKEFVMVYAPRGRSRALSLPEMSRASVLTGESLAR